MEERVRSRFWTAFGLAASLAGAVAAQPQTSRTPTKLPPGALFFRCLPEQDAARLALNDLQEASASTQEQRDDRSAAELAVRKSKDLSRKVLAGEPVLEPYDAASRLAALEQGASSPRSAELFRRAALDQLGRAHFRAATQRASWAAGLSDNARAYAYKVIASEGCGVDQANTAWMKAELEKDGWFTISRFGGEADQAAWLLVQHADRDRDFQAQVLRILEPLVARKETGPKNYAYLHDRVAAARGQPQRYGTQGRCTGSGVWEPFEVEEPAKLDERRASVGLNSVREYKAIFVSSCPEAAPLRPGAAP